MLPDMFPPNDGEARSRAIFDNVIKGNFTAPWGTVVVSKNGHTGKFKVFADALKIGDVRVSVSAELSQQIADVLHCSLLTPRLADLVFMNRALKADGTRFTLKPQFQPVDRQGYVVVPNKEQPGKTVRVLMDSTAAMIAENDKINDAIEKEGGIGSILENGEGLAGAKMGIIQTVGKHWVISNALGQHPGKAENYGWHFMGDSIFGARWESAVTPLAGFRVVQGEGWFHDMKHADASQTLVLVSRDCEVDGAKMDLLDVFTSKELAPLVNHDGVLRVLRQPGVKEMPSVPNLADKGATILSKLPTGVATAGGLVAGAMVAGPPGAVVGGLIGGAVDYLKKRI
jgi:hypothetical protein